jgi:uncharacterized protein YdeI (YjbR/CyaY-like superfamily)
MNDCQLFESKAAWQKWLASNNNTSHGLWLRLAKKGSGETSVTYPEAIDIALCWGWIDGQKKPESDLFWLQRFTPRRPKSIWSKINCAKVEVLIEQGAMQPSGLIEIERAKADGRWDNAYEGSRTIQVPDELQAALDANPKAAAFFKTLNSQNRYAVLFRITTAVKPETRAKRIEKLVVMMELGEKLYP